MATAYRVEMWYRLKVGVGRPRSGEVFRGEWRWIWAENPQDAQRIIRGQQSERVYVMKWKTTIEKGDADAPVDDEARYEQELRIGKVRQYLADLEEYEDDLTAKQYEFVTESRARVERYGVSTLFSERQYGWLKGLWEQHCDGDSGDDFGGEEEDEF